MGEFRKIGFYLVLFLPGTRVGAGGGGIFGGPPLACGNGCCCSGAFGSTSSHSEDKSPELNLSND